MGQLKQTNVSVIEVSKEGEREMLKKTLFKNAWKFSTFSGNYKPIDSRVQYFKYRKGKGGRRLEVEEGMGG